MTGGLYLSSNRKKSSVALSKRSWQFSVLVAMAVVAVGVAVSGTLNPMIGRSIHWDWMAAIAPAMFIVLTLGLRNRWW